MKALEEKDDKRKEKMNKIRDIMMRERARTRELKPKDKQLQEKS
jgi:hypothetical protein